MKNIVMAFAVFAVAAGYMRVYAQQGTTANTQTEVKKAPMVDPVDPNLKGPKGQVIYSGPQGGKYYKSTNDRKIYIDANVDKTMKGPKGETVYTGPQGGKYFINERDEKVWINHGNKTQKPVPDKQGTVKKAERSGPPSDNR